MCIQFTVNDSIKLSVILTYSHRHYLFSLGSMYIWIRSRLRNDIPEGLTVGGSKIASLKGKLIFSVFSPCGLIIKGDTPISVFYIHGFVCQSV